MYSKSLSKPMGEQLVYAIAPVGHESSGMHTADKPLRNREMRGWVEV